MLEVRGICIRAGTETIVEDLSLDLAEGEQCVEFTVRLSRD